MGKLKEGYIQIYTGNGKGKTTAAVGLATRAAGREYKVCMVQFLKTSCTGELKSAEKLKPYFNIFRFESPKGFYWNLNDEQKRTLKEEVQKAYEFCLEVLKNKEYDILIMDEIMGALKHDLVTEEQILHLMDVKPVNMELIMTGRNVPKSIFEKADLVTEMKDLKHYIDKGVVAREGIEY